MWLAALLFNLGMLIWKATPQLYLSMCIKQQQVAHGASLHATEYILTRDGAALSDQEIPTTGEEWLRLLSSQPEMKGTELQRKEEGDVH